MPGLLRKLVIVAAVEGLIVYAPGRRNHRSLQIKYANHDISSLAKPATAKDLISVDVHGIVGLLTLAPVAYLIAISRREQVAQIRGIPVFVITDVVLIPLSSQSEAERAIDEVKVSRRQSSQIEHQQFSSQQSDTSEDEEVPREHFADEDEQASPVDTAFPDTRVSTESEAGPSQRRSSNVAEDVISRKGQYGRFAERWFSRKGWSTEKRRAQGMSPEDPQRLQPTSFQGDRSENKQAKPEESDVSDQKTEVFDRTQSIAHTLLPKLLRTTRTLLGSRSFFFSYDLDITRRLGDQGGRPSSDLALHKAVDPLFFWNHHLALPLIKGDHHSFVLPLMQGFVGQRAFTIKTMASEEPLEATADTPEGEASITVKAHDHLKASSDGSNFLITLISRRSIKRPGLRYLRRGIDDEGETANTVETEQILSKATWPSDGKVYSFTQMRGSIPLFFSQQPYSFKPVPVLQHSPQANQRAFQRHFQKLVSRYGGAQIALLVDKKGGEAEIGRKYEGSTAQMNATGGVLEKRVEFEWFDFHAMCRGMKFENVSQLVKTLGSKLDEFGITVEVGGTIRRRQIGVLRTNCMDCLDRTNVVQSACGQRVLEQELEEEGIKIDLLDDATTQWFNSLWADNGDQISREYSSTAALKGDYTRTRQRNYRGAINDLGLSLSRYYNNMINDYFSQAAIDYLLGNVTSEAFDEFEATLGNRDPAVSMAKIRANAVDNSVQIVIADQKEDLIGGWTFMSPAEPDSVRTLPLQECVLLLTDAALYRVKFDWNVEKVASFERVDVRSILGIVKGTYITSILTATQRDAGKNVGFVIKYRAGSDNIKRVNTRSLSSAASLDGADAQRPDNDKATGTDIAAKVLAFKALHARDSAASNEERGSAILNERKAVDEVCEHVRTAVLGDSGDMAGFVEDMDIISLEEAKKSTGLFEQWSHSLKKMVWA